MLDASGTTFKTLSTAPGAERLITVEVMCDVTGWTLYRYYAPSVDVGCPLLQGVVSPAARGGVPAQGPISHLPVLRLWIR